MKRILGFLALLASLSCGGALKGGTLNLPLPVATHNVGVWIFDKGTTLAVVGAECSSEGVRGLTNANGFVLLQGIPEGIRLVVCTKDGYSPATSASFNNNIDQTNVQLPMVPIYPLPPTRDYIMASTESFQGSVLHTTQFGDLNWWPTAWTSLNDTDRAMSYPQIASWGDTDITVSIAWDYGEGGQPYGTGQLVPPTDLTASLQRFRILVEDVIKHQAKNGQPFVPTIFMEGDNGFTYYMWVMPLVIQALQSQPNDPIDLTNYVRIRMCYDSCVPGWQPPSQVDEAILATRATCPNCVIALELSSGFPFWGGETAGQAQYETPAGQALDEVDWEGNSWPPSNWDQYWQVLARLLGPLYQRPPNQPAADDPPPVPCYACGNTPRGPRAIHCFEPFTYQWVRGQVPTSQVPVALSTLRGLGCQAIDLPQ